MKRIVNGVTYNTDTATKIARSEWDADDGPTVGVLYQTRGGAFFVHRRTQKEVWNELSHEAEQNIADIFEPLSAEGAHAWILEGEVEVFHNPFEDPPEAAAEAEPQATIYMRVPPSLKKRVDEAAKGDGVSGNAWAMRCVEQCLADDRPATIRDYQPLACIMEISSVWMMGHEWDEKKQLDALRTIYKNAFKLCEDLGINTERALNDMAEENVGSMHTEIRREFRPYPDHQEDR